MPINSIIRKFVHLIFTFPHTDKKKKKKRLKMYFQQKYKGGFKGMSIKICVLNT